MHNEKLQDIDDARGVDVVACDPPVTPPPTTSPSTNTQRMHIYPHR
jgi:hypothetical protein